MVQLVGYCPQQLRDQFLAALHDYLDAAKPSDEVIGELFRLAGLHLRDKNFVPVCICDKVNLLYGSRYDQLARLAMVFCGSN